MFVSLKQRIVFVLWCNLVNRTRWVNDYPGSMRQLSFLKKKGRILKWPPKIGEEGLNSLQKKYKGFLFFLRSRGSVCFEEEKFICSFLNSLLFSNPQMKVFIIFIYLNCNISLLLKKKWSWCGMKLLFFIFPYYKKFHFFIPRELSFRACILKSSIMKNLRLPELTCILIAVLKTDPQTQNCVWEIKFLV